MLQSPCDNPSSSSVPELVLEGLDVDGARVGADLMQLTKHPFRPVPLEIHRLLELNLRADSLQRECGLWSVFQ